MASGTNQNEENNAESNEENEQVPDWLSAKRGIRMLINNNAKEAQELFCRYPDSLTMFAGYSFATFMDALMTFEDDKLNLATSVLKEVERKCTSETGWFKSVKKVFGTSDIHRSLAESLETQIILADSQVCLAILTFLQQDISGYFKGGWVLRKAWKVYQSTYHDILQLHKEIVGETHTPLPGNPESSPETTNSPDTSKSDNTTNGYIKKIPYSHSAILTHHQNDSSGTSTPNSMKNNCSRSSIDASALTFLKKSFSVNSALSKNAHRSDWSSFTSSLSLAYITSTFHLFSSTERLKSAEIDKPTIERLMGAVSFGYGLFQLGISLLPPSLLKLTNFLGFGGNRQNGIACLMYAREGVDMRAPLATLSLLWYHTIVRPFYAIDGSNVQAGVNAAMQLLQESEAEYGQSALFLFFRGRCNRLKSDIPTALKSFQLSVDNASQREIKILALHEVGWCHLIQLDYCAAENTFTYLKSWSRWSRAFYSYLAGICCGSCENSSNYANIKEIKTSTVSGSKGNQLDEFLCRRAKCCPSDDDVLAKLPSVFWKLLVYEMLYLWNALPSCSPENIENIKRDCEAIRDGEIQEPMLGLSKLILGCCYCIQRRYLEGINKFRICLEQRRNLPNNAVDAHVSAFSQYELGSLLIKSFDTKAEGKLLLQNISHYKDYDFEQRLNVRVHSMLKHL
ncbi:tetratricopeptide repeat protein 39C-like [Asbolus verrucosus]|uniref:Tetratricopeptide repeat protein 39C-like n=1 Tax=Asbolus verrucosus TaxID=1661398 RepID=A0A482VIS2_ASBVE|nr:tetratricopeptide repeat protein 39C-like [Asbolus verrucosus]